MRLSNAQVKSWAQFYARLAAVNCWKGFTAWLVVILGGKGAEIAGAVDLSGLTIKGAASVLVGTIALKIALAWNSNPPPEPTAPGFAE